LAPPPPHTHTHTYTYTDCSCPAYRLATELGISNNFNDKN